MFKYAQLFRDICLYYIIHMLSESSSCRVRKLWNFLSFTLFGKFAVMPLLLHHFRVMIQSKYIS